jgi:hypothetical protein
MNKTGLFSVQEQNLNVIVGIFLLILAVCGNFVAETLSCQLQKLLSTNMLAKNLIIIMIIYFSLGFTNPSNNVNPLTVILHSLMIWFFFIIFNKMAIEFTLVAFSGLFSILLCKNFADYYHKQDKEKNKKFVELLLSTSDALFGIVCLIILIGFILYFSKQYHDYSKDFSYITFLFGKNVCASLA